MPRTDSAGLVRLKNKDAVSMPITICRVRLEPRRGARLLKKETDTGIGVPMPTCCFPKNMSLLEQSRRKYFSGGLSKVVGNKSLVFYFLISGWLPINFLTTL